MWQSLNRCLQFSSFIWLEVQTPNIFNLLSIYDQHKHRILTFEDNEKDKF